MIDVHNHGFAHQKVVWQFTMMYFSTKGEECKDLTDNGDWGTERGAKFERIFRRLHRNTGAPQQGRE